MKKLTKILSALALVGLAQASFAATSTSANFQATATLNSSCVVTATNVAFGTITPAATGTASATGTITSRCSNNVGYTLSINAGSGTIAARTMTGATNGNTDKLAYNLYQDAGYATLWGDGTTGSKVSLTGSGVTQTSTVYGTLSLNQYIKPDTYADNLTVTLSY